MAIAARRPYRGVTCPHCEGTLPPQAAGPLRCPLCARESEIVRFEPVEPLAVGASLALGGPAEGTPCARHAGNRAEVACQRCGQFICGLCRIDTEGRSLCPACFERLSSEGTLPGSARRFRNHARLAGTCLVGSIFVFFLAAPLAALGLFWAIQGIREKGRLKESEGRGELYILAVLCGLFALGGAALIVVFIMAVAGGKW